MLTSSLKRKMVKTNLSSESKSWKANKILGDDGLRWKLFDKGGPALVVRCGSWLSDTVAFRGEVRQVMIVVWGEVRPVTIDA